MNKRILLSSLIAISLQISASPFALAQAQSIPASPAPPQVLPAAATPAGSFAATAKTGSPEESLNRSDDTPPEPAGVKIPQPAQPSGGKDLLQTGAAKPGNLPRFALTLAGGGARGAAHIGVLKKLEAEGLKPDFIAGSSIGAAIGALYASGVPASEIERMALSGKFKRAYFPIPFELKALVYFPTYVVKRILQMHPVPGIYTGKSIARFIRTSLPNGEKNIEDLPTPFAAITVNMLDSKPFWVTKGDVGSAVQASCTVAGLYQPVDTGERLLVDGGMRANLPAEVGKAAGAPLVVGVRLHSLLETKNKKDFSDIVNYGERITSIFMAEIESKAMDDADIVISPDVEEISIADFSREHLARAIREGEAAAAQAIPKIREMIRRTEGTAARPVTEQLQQ
jgi:NTE family protein